MNIIKLVLMQIRLYRRGYIGVTQKAWRLQVSACLSGILVAQALLPLLSYMSAISMRDI